MNQLSIINLFSCLVDALTDAINKYQQQLEKQQHLLRTIQSHRNELMTEAERSHTNTPKALPTLFTGDDVSEYAMKLSMAIKSPSKSQSDKCEQH